MSTDNGPQKPSIVMAIGALRGGGAERVVVNLVNHWPEDRYRPVLLLANRSGPYLAHIKPSIEVLSCDISSRVIDAPRAVFRIRQVLEGIQPAAIFAHGIATSRMFVRARTAGMLPAPLFMVVHSNAKAWLEHERQRNMTRWLLKRELGWMFSKADGLIAVSKGAGEELKSLFPGSLSNVQTVHNPIDLEQIEAAVRSTPADPFVQVFTGLRKPIILTVGRLSPEKNQALLLRAYAQMPRHSRGSLVVLGEGNTRVALESLARELKIESEVYFPGFLPNPWWYMRRADLYVLSSTSEAYPMVLIEALACGLPVIATNCRHGPAEIIRNESFGTLVPVDDPIALANAMSRRLRSPRIDPRLHDEVQIFLETQRPESVAKRYLDVLINSSSKAPQRVGS